MKCVAAYVRVSTLEQNEVSQKLEIQRWLAGNGIDVASVRWFIDKSTGDDLDRPAFEEMQRAIFLGEVGTVVVYKIDRLSRSMRDGINVVHDWNDKGVRLVSVTQGFDFTGTFGKVAVMILLAFAEMEQEYRRDRQRGGIAAAKDRGVYKGRKPGTLKGDPARAVELRGNGLSIDEIARSLGVSRNTVVNYLRQSKEVTNGQTA